VFVHRHARSTLVYEDNVGALHLANNPRTTPNSKHIDIRHHFIRERVARGEFKIPHVPSHLQHADFLTKPLPRESFLVHRSFTMNTRRFYGGGIIYVFLRVVLTSEKARCVFMLP
ncbi:unnamed protein product, partial [Pylaiella littoralis]